MGEIWREVETPITYVVVIQKEARDIKPSSVFYEMTDDSLLPG